MSAPPTPDHRAEAGADAGAIETLDVVADRALAMASRGLPVVVRVSLAIGDVTATVDLDRTAVVDAVVPATPARPPVPAAAPEPDTVDEAGTEPSGMVHEVRATTVGTFYRRPGPNEDEFVVEGDHVPAGRQIGLVEAMKLMIPVESDVAGTVVEFPVSDGDPVEYGQTLLVIEVDP